MALEQLVDIHQFRTSVVRRLFQNSPAEVIEEIFQNAQRAGASQVSITTTHAGLRIRDDGHGIADLDGFQTLLQIAATQYHDPSVAEHQQPMGVGIQSLLAFDGIQEVVFRSGTRTIRIDTHRWWTDTTYAVRWAERVEACDPIEGFEIHIHCPLATVQAFHETLQTTCYCYPFKLELDGIVLPSRLPTWAIPDTVLMETTYQGNRLIIGYNRYQTYGDRRSCVNWYGQLIRTSLKPSDSTAFMYYLEVIHGRPVNPIAPTRQSIINDDAFAALHQWIEDAIYTYLFDPANRTHITPQWIKACYRLLPERCAAGAPLFVADPWHDRGNTVECVEDMHPHTDTPTILAYADQPLLLKPEGILVDQAGGHESFDYGLASFIGGLDQPAYSLVCGNPTRLRIAQVYWKPGPSIEGIFFEAGTWAIGTNPDHLVWHPVRHRVYLFNWSDCWSIEGVDFHVGLLHESERRVFYETAAWAGHDREHDTSDGETLYAAYHESCQVKIRELIGACIPPINLGTIKHHLPDSEARLTRITFLYDSDCSHPRAICAQNERGEERELTFL